MKIMNFISYKVIPFLTGEYKKPDVFITNMNYLNWKWLKKGILSSQKYLKGKCADIGAGVAPYEKYIVPYVEEYIVTDNEKTHKCMFKNSKTQFLNADIKNLPFENESVDTVVLTQVLEHVDDPFKALREVKRVLKTEGILIFSVPFIYHAHAVPYDYYRFSEYGLKKICDDLGFEIKEFLYQGYFGTAVVSIVNGFIWELASKNKYLRNFVFLPFLLVFFTVNNLAGILLDKIKNKNFTPNFWLVVQKR